MTLDVRTKCAVCAWREACTKKFKLKEGSLHCPDYTRDVTLPKEDDEQASEEPAVKHKRVEDVFGDS